MTTLDWLWTLWFGAMLVTFAILETYAFRHDKVTLSRYLYGIAQVWPLFPLLLGLGMGGAAVHLFWHWCPEVGIGQG